MDLKLTTEELLDAPHSLPHYFRGELETEVGELQAGLLLDYQIHGQ